MPMRSVGIIAYGTSGDRARVEALARRSKKSVSKWLIDKIRSDYVEAFGHDLPDALQDVNPPPEVDTDDKNNS